MSNWQLAGHESRVRVRMRREMRAGWDLDIDDGCSKIFIQKVVFKITPQKYIHSITHYTKKNNATPSTIFQNTILENK